MSYTLNSTSTDSKGARPATAANSKPYPPKGKGGFGQKKAPNTHLREEDSFANMGEGPDFPFYKGSVYGVDNVLISLEKGNKVTVKVGGEVVEASIDTKPYTTKTNKSEVGFGTPNIHPTHWLFFNIGETAKGKYIRSRMGKEKRSPDYDSQAQGANTFGVQDGGSATDTVFG